MAGLTKLSSSSISKHLDFHSKASAINGTFKFYGSLPKSEEELLKDIKLMKKCPHNFHVNNRGFSGAVETFFSFTFKVLTSKTIHCSKWENIRVNFEAN